MLKAFICLSYESFESTSHPSAPISAAAPILCGFIMQVDKRALVSTIWLLLVGRPAVHATKDTGVSRATNNSDFRFFLSYDTSLLPPRATEGTHMRPSPCRPEIPTLFSLAHIHIIYDEILKWASKRNKCGEIELLEKLVNLLKVDARSCTNLAVRRWMADLKTQPTWQMASLITSDMSFCAAAQICRPPPHARFTLVLGSLSTPPASVSSHALLI